MDNCINSRSSAGSLAQQEKVANLYTQPMGCQTPSGIPVEAATCFTLHELPFCRVKIPLHELFDLEVKNAAMRTLNRNVPLANERTT